MAISDKNMRDALVKIAETASAAVGERMDDAETPDRYKENGHKRSGNKGAAQFGCTIRALPTRLLIAAGETATRINPINAPVFGPMAELSGDIGATPMFAAIVMAKYWGPQPRVLTVSFMETTPADLRSRIVSHMNAWNETACISFAETQRTGDVRISTGPGGYWSYLGTDILHVPKNRQTMNLQDFTMQTSDAEFKRVVRHETGHTLGMPHEHMRKELVALLDRDKTYVYFRRNQGWNKQTVDQQVLTSLDDRTLMQTPPDQTSIMCYQLPGAITRNGHPIPGGTDINATDFAFAAQCYPKPAAASMGLVADIDREHDWAISDDVEVRV